MNSDAISLQKDMNITADIQYLQAVVGSGLIPWSLLRVKSVYSLADCKLT